jgi:hypothetical protein
MRFNDYTGQFEGFGWFLFNPACKGLDAEACREKVHGPKRIAQPGRVWPDLYFFEQPDGSAVFVYKDGFRHTARERSGRRSGIGGAISSVTSAVKQAATAATKPIAQAATAVAKPIGTVAAKIDPTNPANVGSFVATYITRPIAASVAAGLTGGLSVLAAETKVGQNLGLRSDVLGVKPAVTAAVEGAVIGGAIVAAPVIGSAVAGTSVTGALSAVGTALPIAGSLFGGGKPPAGQQPAQPPVQVVPEALPEGYEIDPATGQLRKKSSGGTLAAALAGGGIGLVAGGPIGAVVGAGVGVATGMMAKKKAEAAAGLAGFSFGDTRYSFRSPAARRMLNRY